MKENIEKLFVMFGRLNITDSKQYQGAGLALCRHLAELMGGSAGVVSEPKKGSIFFAILPLTPPSLLPTEK